MIYYLSRVVDRSFNDAVRLVGRRLEAAGLGVLTDIDVREVFHAKLGLTTRNYRILGVCDAKLAYDALHAENKIGTLLPCNMIIQEMEDGTVEIASVDPVASMFTVQNAEVKRIAKEMQAKLKDIMENL